MANPTDYRCAATTLTGLVQMLAANYLPHGYWFYVTGCIPAGKDRRAVDEKILAKYGIALSRQQRARRKLKGLANLHYLRFEDFFVILATHGQHRFFAEEAKSIRDARKLPILIGPYSIGVKRGQYLRRLPGQAAPAPDARHRVRVQIARSRFREICSDLIARAARCPAAELACELARLPVEPYAPIRKQLLKLIRAVNKRRQAAALGPVPIDCLRLKRRICQPFDEVAPAPNGGIGLSDGLVASVRASPLRARFPAGGKTARPHS